MVEFCDRKISETRWFGGRIPKDVVMSARPALARRGDVGGAAGVKLTLPFLHQGSDCVEMFLSVGVGFASRSSRHVAQGERNPTRVIIFRRN